MKPKALRPLAALLLATLLLALTSLVAGAEPLRILCIGDSITQGGKEDRDEFTYRHPLYGMLKERGIDFDFIGTRQEGLQPKAKWPQPFDADHEGYYGAKTASVLEKIRQHLPQLPPPDFALIHLGTNDQKSEDHEATVAKPLEEMIGLLRGKNPEVVIFLGHLNFKDGHAARMRPIVQAMIDRTTTEKSPVVAVHHYRDFNADPKSPDTDTFDWAHPNPKGQEKMAAAWLAAMTPFLPHADKVPPTAITGPDLSSLNRSPRQEPPRLTGARWYQGDHGQPLQFWSVQLGPDAWASTTDDGAPAALAATLGSMGFNHVTLTVPPGRSPAQLSAFHHHLREHGIHASIDLTALDASELHDFLPLLTNDETAFVSASLPARTTLDIQVPRPILLAPGLPPASSLEPLTAANFVMVPISFPARSFLLDDPAVRPSPWAKAACTRLHHRPLWVTLPPSIAATDLLATAAIAARQGWSGVTLTQLPVDDATRRILPTAAFIFRRDMAEDHRELTLVLPANNAASPDVPTTLSTGFEARRTSIALQGRQVPIEQNNSFVTAELDLNLLDDLSGTQSDSGPLRRQWVEGWQVIDTPRTQAIQGFIKGGELRTTDAVFRPGDPFNIIAVSSLTNDPISLSGELLLVAINSSTPAPAPSPSVSGTVALRFDRPPAFALVEPLHHGHPAAPVIKIHPTEIGEIIIDLATLENHPARVTLRHD